MGLSRKPTTGARRSSGADVVVFDDIWVGSDVGTGELARELRAEGTAVVGGTPNTDRLEADRDYAMSVLEDHGVNTVEHHVFHDFGAGIRFVRENPAPYVIKPLGEVQNVKRLLYVGRGRRRWRRGGRADGLREGLGPPDEGVPATAQGRGGVEVAICGFFDGNRFVDRVNFNFEHKKLFPGNIGPQTGEMGTSMFWADRNRLFAETLGRSRGGSPTRGTSAAST